MSRPRDELTFRGALRRRHRAARLFLWTSLAALGCTGPGATGDSSAGSADSGNSSAGSGDSSAGSGDASGNSAEASRSSAASSGESGVGSVDATEESSNATAQNVLAGLASTAVLGTTVGGVALTVWGVHSAVGGAAPSIAAAQAYLEGNELQLAQDLTLGAGPSVEDLAAMAAIRPTHRARFGALLRKNRALLLDLADPARVDTERTRRFLRTLGALAREDRVLVVDYRAFIGRHAEGSDSTIPADAPRAPVDTATASQ